MSKLLAMMMKPKNYMYAMIKGTLTENPSGVFSGFSSENYLSLPSLNFNSNNTEIVIKFTTGATISNQLILNVGSNQLYISSSSHLTFKISYGGNKWLTGASLIQPNTTYYAKFINTSDGCTLYLSTDNINWNLDGNTTNFHITSNNAVYIGGGNTSYTTWSGSIDLNQSYIKINNTRYQLQAVVGYTVVGSPTIVDGVVSGFSANDYIADNNTFDISSNFEICVKINSWEGTGSTQYFLSLRGNKNLNLYFGASGNGIACYYGSYWYDLASNLTVGVPITIKVSGNGTDITITVIQGNYSNTSSKSISKIDLNGNFIIHFGKGGATLPFTSGEIDFNNSYEIRNGTKYIFILP